MHVCVGVRAKEAKPHAKARAQHATQRAAKESGMFAKKKMCGFFTLVMLCKVKKLYRGAVNEPEEMDFPHVKMHFKDFSFVCFVLIDKRYDFPFSFAYWLLV